MSSFLFVTSDQSGGPQGPPDIPGAAATAAIAATATATATATAAATTAAAAELSSSLSSSSASAAAPSAAAPSAATAASSAATAAPSAATAAAPAAAATAAAANDLKASFSRGLHSDVYPSMLGPLRGFVWSSGVSAANTNNINPNISSAALRCLLSSKWREGDTIEFAAAAAENLRRVRPH